MCDPCSTCFIGRTTFKALEWFKVAEVLEHICIAQIKLAFSSEQCVACAVVTLRSDTVTALHDPSRTRYVYRPQPHDVSIVALDPQRALAAVVAISDIISAILFCGLCSRGGAVTYSFLQQG